MSFDPATSEVIESYDTLLWLSYQEPLFGKDYVAVSETKKQEFIPPKGYKQVQAADDFIYEKICYEVNKQMKKAFEWWKKMA